ncbi:hypothetical protein SLS60_006410 [Paraconiothyrium brasiliense]|uniref:Uncharacterized protein n=1 Tax=Paraconiothyrium brasiliense TaxID=300254 RepID=A0ABR3RAN2_9PLEO
MLMLWIRSLPALGAALIILSLFVDPFFQQIIALGERQTTVTENAVSIPRAMRYSKGMDMPRFGRNLTKETVNYDRHTPQVLQLRGNDEALALHSGPVDFYYLPNGLYMEREQTFDLQLKMIISSTYNASDTISFRNEPTLLWSVATIRYHNDSEPHFTASECGLSLCVRRITSTSVSGVLEEQSSEINASIKQSSKLPPVGYNSTTESGLDISDPEAGHFVTTTGFPRRDLIFYAVNGNFSMPQTSINSIGRELHSLFFEDVTSKEYINVETHTNGTFQGRIPRRVPSGYYISIGDGIGTKYRPSPMQVLNSVSDHAKLFDNVAESITINLRQNDENNTVVHGTSAVVVYNIRWLYIILPAVSTLGGTVFLLLSVWQTRRLGAPLWKSSAVAILKCGASLNGFAEGQSQVSEIDALAKNTSFQLVGTTYKPSLAPCMLDQDTSYTREMSAKSSRFGEHLSDAGIATLSSDQRSTNTTGEYYSLRAFSPIDEMLLSNKTAGQDQDR